MGRNPLFRMVDAMTTKPTLRWTMIGTMTAMLAVSLLTAVWRWGDIADYVAAEFYKATPRPPTVQLSHTCPVHTFTFFANGRYLLTEPNVGEVMLWDARSGQRLGWMDDAGERLGTWISYVFTPDQRRIITSKRTAEMVLWDATSIKRIRTLREADGQSPPPIFALSPNSRSVLFVETTPELRLELQSLDSGKVLWTSPVKSDEPLGWAQFSDDGLYVIARDGRGGFHVWDARGGQYVWEPSMRKPYPAELLEQRQAEMASIKPPLDDLTRDAADYLLFLSHVRPDGKILSYSVPSGRIPGRLWFVRNRFFSSDGKRYVSRNEKDVASNQDEVVLWDVTSAKPLSIFFEDAERSDAFTCTRDGRYFTRRIRSKEAEWIDAATGETLRTFAGHADEITALALAPNEETILTGDKSGIAILWNIATGARIRRFAGHGKNVRCVAYSPDSSSILVAGDDGRTKAYSTQTGRELFVLKSSVARVTHALAMYSPDGTRIITQNHWGTSVDLSETALWDAATGEQVACLADVPTHRIALSPNGRWALGIRTIPREPTVPELRTKPLRLWNTDSSVEVHSFDKYYHGEPTEVDDVVQRPSTDSAAVREEFGSRRWGWIRAPTEVWLTESGRDAVASIPGLDDDTRAWLINLGAKAIGAPSFENRENRTLVRSRRTLREIRAVNTPPYHYSERDTVAVVFDRASNKSIATLDARPSIPQTATFNHDETRALVAYQHERKMSLIIWDLATAQKIRQFVIPGEDHMWTPDGTTSYRSMMLSPDERFVALAIGRRSTDELAYLLDLQGDASFVITGKPSRYTMRSIALFSPDNRRMVCFGDRAVLWDIETQRPLVDLGRSYNGLDDLVFNSSGRWLISSGNYGTVMWDAESGKERHKLGPRYQMLLRFDPSGTRMIISTSSPPRQELWDFESGELISDLTIESDKGLSDAFFTPAGDRVITTHSHTLAVWDATDGRRLCVYQDASYEAPFRDAVQSPLFLADGRLVTVQHAEAIIWDLETAKPLQRFPFPRGQPRVLLRPGNAQLLTVSRGDAILWDIDTGAKRQTFYDVPAGVGRAPNAIEFSGDGQFIVAHHRRGELAVVWDVNSGEIVRRCYLLDEGQNWLTELPATGQFFGATDLVK